VLEGLERQLEQPGDAIRLIDQRESVERALSELPSEQRRAIVLAFFGGCTHVQVAEQLGIPLGTAKTRIALGMRRLATLLESDHRERAT
jgi:RNA polymerase sigma-70 factor (ECF subfamily)